MPGTPLSGDVTGIASSHPVDPAASPIVADAKIPKGAIPASNPPQPAEPAPAPSQPTDQGDTLGRAPASSDDWLSQPPENVAPPAPAASSDDWLSAPPEASGPPPPAPAASPMRQVIDTNLQAHYAAKPEVPPGQAQTELQPEDFYHDLLGGLGLGAQNSVTGLATRGKLPDHILPEHADMAMRIGSMIGQFAGDLPAMAAGLVGGGTAGASAGTAVLPVVGTVSGAAVGAAMGAFAAPAAIRKMYIDHYTNGNIADAANPAREFAARLMATSWEAIKGGTTGAATALTGGIVSPVAGKMAGAASELVAMTTVGAALEGRLPQPQEFLDGALMVGGLHALGHVAGPADRVGTVETKINAPETKLQNIYAATGETPAAITEQAKTDVKLQQDLVAGNAQEPSQATPTTLNHDTVKETLPEGSTEAPGVIGTNTALEPKTAAEVGAERLPPKRPPDLSLETASKDAEDDQYFDSKIAKNGEAPGKSWGELRDEWYTKAVDYLNPVNKAETLAKERGANINADNSAEEEMRRARAAGDTANLITSDGLPDENGKFTGDSPDKIFKDMDTAGLDKNQFRRYAMAADALADTEHESGLDLDRAQRVVDKYAPQYKEFNDRLNGFRKELLQWAADNGRYTQEQVDTWSANDAYSPRKRAFEADMWGEEQGPGGRGIKERVGSTRDIIDPLAQTLADTQRMVKDVLINKSRSTFVDNMLEGNLVDVDGKWTETAVQPVLKVSTQEGALEKNQIAIYRDGERQVFEGSPLLIDSMKRLDGNPAGMDLTSKILRGFTNTVRLGVVSNPAFGLAHFIRGQIMAGVNSDTGLIPFVHPAMALASMFRDPEGFKQFLYEGIGGGRYLDQNGGYLASDLAKEDNTGAPTFGKAWNSALNPLHWSEGFIRLTDTATKLAEAQRTVAQGGTMAEGIKNSRMVTPDYANVGLQQSVLRTGVAFIGAHINSLDNMQRVFERDPVGAMAHMSVISGMSAAVWYLNKDDEAIDAVPDWQKNTYWNINVSRFSPDYRGAQDATIVRIPKPWAPGILFGSGVETALDAYFKPRPQELQHFAENLTKSVIPEVMPNVFQPVLDQYSNKQAFTGRPLVPFYKEKLLPEMQYSAYTSETAKAIGKLIGYVPLVKDIGPSTDTLASPAVVENYIRSWGGTLGGWALNLSDKAISKATGAPDRATPWQDTPVLHSFVSRYPSFQDQRIQDFYENRDKADAAYNSAKAAAKMGDFDAAQRIQDAHPDFQVRLDSIAKGMTTARKTYENVQENPNLPNDQKRQQLDSLLFQIGSMAKMGNQMMSDFHRGAVQNVVKGNGQ